MFDFQNYTEEKKVKLAAMEFIDYANVWWDQYTSIRHKSGECSVSSWFEMKTIMRKRFVPQHYYRELYNRLQRLTQGSRNIEEYQDRKSTRLNSSHSGESRMPSSA